MSQLRPSELAASLAQAAPSADVMAGLIGRGIMESRTPWMHEREGAAQGLRLDYRLFDFSAQGWQDEDLAALLDVVQGAGLAGVNVTYPFKQAVLPLLDELSPQAAAVGAVNTVAFRDGRRIGYNTDISGFADAFTSGLPSVALHRVLQLGCGGAGSATAHALLPTIGAQHLVLYDTDPARAQALQAQLTAAYGETRVSLTDQPAAAAAQADGIVNATPIGMAKFPGMPIAPNALVARHWVSEIIYFPLETELLAKARALGCRVLNGRGMAVGQAADAFAIFTTRQPDRARMATSFAAFSQNAAL
jgi:shikimate dehydrogenase